MSLRNNQNGFSAFEFVLLIVVLGVLAVGALRVMNSQHGTTTVSSTSVTTAGATKAPAVKDTKDLSTAANVLDQNDPANSNSGDSKQLDSQLQ
jgi:Tfp pilus assembly protein FimT